MKNLLILVILGLVLSQDIKILLPEDSTRKTRLANALKAVIKPEVQSVITNYMPDFYYSKYNAS